MFGKRKALKDAARRAVELENEAQSEASRARALAEHWQEQARFYSDRYSEALTWTQSLIGEPSDEQERLRDARWKTIAEARGKEIEHLRALVEKLIAIETK